LVRLHYFFILIRRIGDSAAELVGLTNSYATRRRFNKLLPAMSRPDGPAFVVLNDDMPERQLVKETKAMDTLIFEWMEKLWPTKVKAYCT